LRSRKIKINPTREQKEKFNEYACAARFTYNTCVAAVNHKGFSTNKMRLRNAFVTATSKILNYPKTEEWEEQWKAASPTEKNKLKENIEPAHNPFFIHNKWLLKTPKIVRQQAAFKAAAAFKSAFTNLRNNNIKRFHVAFKTKKQERRNGYVIGIEKGVTFGTNKLTILKTTIGDVRYFERPPIDKIPDGECKIQRDAYGDFWLLVPVYKATKAPHCGPVLAIDPGARTPFACFSPNGDCFTAGDGMKNDIETVAGRIASIDRRIAKTVDPVRCKILKRHRQTLFRKKERVRDDHHYKIIASMTDKYGGVILPLLQTGRLCRGLKTKTNRQLFGISHYKFLQRMIDKCDEKSLVFASPDEAYTTKTCGSCGTLNPKVGSSKVFSCSKCGLRCDRDLHAARNIYMKWLVENNGVVYATPQAS